VFGVIVLNAELPGGGVVALTVVCTILLSVLGHGLSANPLIAALAGRAKRG
jgi:NhaP-type Na+/H+ or K+/H+ antiporter